MSDLRPDDNAPPNRNNELCVRSRAWRRCLRVVCRPGPFLAAVACIFFCLGQFAGAVQRNEKVLRADAVVAQKFELIGSNGKRAATLATDGNGAAYLTFFDEKQTARLRVGVSDRADSVLMLSDSKGETRLDARISSTDDTPYFILSGGPPLGTTIALSASGSHGYLSLSQTKGGRLSLNVDDEGQPGVYLHGIGGERGISLSANADRQEIALNGKDGKKRVRLIMLPDGSPELSLADETNEVTSIMTLTKDGKMTFRQPPR
jgi:hypothetical protein